MAKLNFNIVVNFRVIRHFYDSNINRTKNSVTKVYVVENQYFYNVLSQDYILHLRCISIFCSNYFKAHAIFIAMFI